MTAKKTRSILDKLRKHSSELTDLHNIMALLQWDQESKMPGRAGAIRADQFATLSAIIHQKEVAKNLGDLLNKAEENLDLLSETDRGLVRVMRRSFDRNMKLPQEFVSEFSRLTSQALQTWVEARQKSNFLKFGPVLNKVVTMCRRQAEYLGYVNEPYDALLDLHEEGLTATGVEKMFAGLGVFLVRAIRKINRNDQHEFVFSPPFDQAAQIKFADRVLAEIGFDFNRGRQDVSAHPFTTSIGHHDRRITNRYRPDSMEFIFSALHEGGHALYEQGINDGLAQTQLDTGISLGVHESQSRLWENIIGRSSEFWQHFYPELKKAFPKQFSDLPVQKFVSAINAVRPGLIRVEADEVTYNLHILVRFEIERELFRGNLETQDLPAVWNEKYKNYLGLEVDSDANGVLQDIHWAHGSFGYFPTYTIGNLVAAQIWAAYCAADPDYQHTLQTGNLKKIRAWLTDKIYRHGSVYPPDVLLKKVTGQGVTSRYFIKYLETKMALQKTL